MSVPDPRAVLATLGCPEPESITPVSGGRDTAIYRVEVPDATYALRIFRPEQQAVSQIELRAMEAAGSAGIPVPHVHAYGSHADCPALLLSWCAGQTVAAALQQQPEQSYALGLACGEMLARIHTITVPADEQRHGWLGWSGIGPEHPLYSRLTAVARNDRLLHLDFHPLNILTDGERVTAVLDWANARPGDPRADLARIVTILRLDTVELPPAFRPIVRVYERGLRDGYTASTGLLSDMPLFYIWAGHAMLHDIAPRLTDNPSQTSRIQRWMRLWERISSSDDSGMR